MEFSDRIKQLIDYEKEKGTTLSKKIGIPGSTISTIKIGKSKPGLEILQAISKAYPQMNLRWLLLGEGDMWIKKEVRDYVFNKKIKQFEEGLDELQKLKKRFEREFGKDDLE